MLYGYYMVTTQEKTMSPSLVAHGFNGRNTPVITSDALDAVLKSRQVGRCSSFNLEVAADVVEGIIDGLTWKQIAAKIGVDRTTIWSWEQASPAFSDAILGAHKAKARAFADDQLNIIADVEIDPANPKMSQMEIRKAEIMGRVRFDQAKCYDPAQFGDKRQIEAVVITETVEARLTRLTANIGLTEVFDED